MRLNFKRLALMGGRVARGVAKLVALTSARLDLVTLLMHGAFCQRDLAAKLCVTEGVVSRLVHALMKLGFVQREIPKADRRFRIVSLTKFGRYELMLLTDSEELLASNARFDVQGLGEARWQADWERPLERMGLGFLAQISASDYEDQEPLEPPYAAMRMQWRAGVYRDPLGAVDTDVAESWPWTVTLLPPPVELGLLADPVSEAWIAAWRPPAGLFGASSWPSPHGPGPLRG